MAAAAASTAALLAVIASSGSSSRLSTAKGVDCDWPLSAVLSAVLLLAALSACWSDDSPCRHCTSTKHPQSGHGTCHAPRSCTPIALSHGFTVNVCGAALAAGHPAIADLRVAGDGNTWLSASAVASACQAATLALAGVQQYGSWQVSFCI